MVSISHVGLRALQLFWTVLITALIGNVIREAFAGNSSSINYAMFAVVLSWLVLTYGLIASFIQSLAIPKILFALDGLAAFFTFVAAVVLSAKLGVHSCRNQGYIISNNLTNGSANPSKRCHELQASTAFFWFLFATYLASLLLTFMSSRSSGMSSRGGIRKVGPSMTQV